MATITNGSFTTATLTNGTLGSSALKWEKANFTWAEGTGTWGNPYTFSNKALTTATITNKALT